MFNLFLWVETFHPHPPALLLSHQPENLSSIRTKGRVMRIQGCVNEEKYLNGQIQKEIPKGKSEGLNLPQMLSRGDSDCSGFSSLKCVSIIKLIQVESLNAGWHEVRFFQRKVRGNMWNWVVVHLIGMLFTIHLIGMDRHQIHHFRIRLARVWSEKITTMIAKNVILIILSRSISIRFDSSKSWKFPTHHHYHLPSSNPDGARKVWSPDTPVVAPAASSWFAST